jgi:TatD DNase family protein
MLIDTHAHLNFKAFDNDFDEVIKRCLAEDIWLINVGSNYDTSTKAKEIAEKYDRGVYAAVGFHPIHSKDEDFIAEDYKKLAGSGKVVAVGEIGLDKFKDYGSFLEKQIEVFEIQLDLAKDMDLPVIIHCRMAHEELLEILNYKLKTKNYKPRGVIHCFTGNWKQAEEYLNMGFYLGINGIIYKMDLRNVIERAPLDRLLLETDCPYLGKEERNEPTFVREIAKDIARIKDISFEEVTQATTQNAQIIFNI